MTQGPINLRSDREINKMRLSGLLVWEAHHQIAPRIRPGVATRDLDAVVEQLFRERGAESLFKGAAGKVPFPAVTCMSVNDEIVHGIPSDRQLKEGDILSVDTGCKLDGWCSDAAVTYPVGHVSPQVQRLLETTKGALELAIQLLATESWWSQVARQMATYVADHGFTVIEVFVGHGIGRQMHEPPQVPNFDSRAFRSRGDFPLRPGLVLAIEPMVSMGTKEVHCLADHWTHVTADGAYSAHFEHTVALTHSGVHVLTAGPDSDA